MIGIGHFVYLRLVGFQVGAVHNIVDPEPEEILMIGDPRTETGGCKRVIHSFLHLCVNVRNGCIIKIAANQGSINI